jgi:predicted metalloprotease with PDZ domain
MKKIFLFVFLTCIITHFANAKSPNDDKPIGGYPIPKTNISYSLSMPQPWTHYFEVSMTLENIDKIDELKNAEYIDFKMPVWTPGSYLVREYAKNVEDFTASNGSNPLKFDKFNKNTWRIYGKSSKITVKYKVYSFELSVRTSYLDDVHGYLNGTSMFLYVPQLKMSPAILTITPYKSETSSSNWTNISTGLKRISEKDFTYFSPNFDILADSPIEIGNHKVLTFNSSGIPHSLAIFSYVPLQYDEKKVTEAFKKVTEAAATVIGENPCEDYTFINHQILNPGGGLEHLNSTTCQNLPNSFISESAIKNAMSLFAHEYFHLWNVKRIRPIALGPFDYDNENYSHSLWVSEGITSFYQWNILLRADILTPDEYLIKVANSIGGIENQVGQKVQSVAEASWDAWIKHYRPNENSRNSTISYYEKGSVIGSLLNLYIIGETKGKKNLDDVFKLLYHEYYKKQNRGFKDEEFQKACEQIAGISMEDFFQKYIWSTENIDYDKYFKYVGLKLIREYDTNTAFLGATIANKKIINLQRGTAAYNGGLSVNDEILEIDNVQTENPLGVISDKKVGDTIKVKIKRQGQEFTYIISLMANPAAKFKLEKVQNSTPEQEMLYKKWLFIK